MDNNNHGGNRIGAGRPKSEPTKVITFRIRLSWEKRIREVVAKEVKKIKNDTR